MIFMAEKQKVSIKNVICKINGISKIYQSKKAKMIDSGNKAISYNEILNGKWFLFH